VSQVRRGRLPDFIIIGTMKSATSSLFYGLGDEPGVALPVDKEPDFFSVEDRWRRGLDWYASRFPEGPAGTITGEASTSYTHPERAALAARRIHEVVPQARLVCVLRHPVERLRSHYRHGVQRGRERRPLALAAEPGSSYVQRSRYDAALAPYVERFGGGQLCVVRTEDLADLETGWSRILDHLGLSRGPARTQRRSNETAAKGQFSGPARVLFERGWLQSPTRLPGPARRVARRVLLRDSRRYRDLLASSEGPVPAASLELVWASAERLTEVLGPEAPRWDR
jgi:hypothetical protein